MPELMPACVIFKGDLETRVLFYFGRVLKQRNIYNLSGTLRRIRRSLRVIANASILWVRRDLNVQDEDAFINDDGGLHLALMPRKFDAVTHSKRILILIYSFNDVVLKSKCSLIFILIFIINNKIQCTIISEFKKE